MIAASDPHALYRALLLPRLIEEKMLRLLRQGKLSKWFSGIGQEAISVGVTAALQDDDWILPLHRNLGVFTTRGVDLERLFRREDARIRVTDAVIDTVQRGLARVHHRADPRTERGAHRGFSHSGAANWSDQPG